MWTYTNQDGSRYAIPYSNIDYVILSRGVETSWEGCFDHKDINKYCNSKFVTVIYKKTGGFIFIEGETAFNQLAITSKDKFICNKD